ncbi:hypothetical protein TNCV_2081351 [Trichonephila clavipes]|nr:hypothetical protein TNCV_2081351 [Trichonephila clavipes]
MGETVDSELGILELKQKLLSRKAYLEDEEFVCDFLDTAIEDRMVEEEYKKKKEYRKEIEEHHLERKQELEFARIEARWKTERD